MVLAGWSRIGMFVQLFGFINLFGSFMPLALSFLRTLPIIGTFLNLPVVSTVMDRLAGKEAPSKV